MKDSFEKVTALLPPPLQEEIQALTKRQGGMLTEIRLRAGQYASYRFCGGNGRREEAASGRVFCDNNFINECINKFINYSYYAYEDEMRCGYITLTGGHRVGICGHAVTENGKVRLLRNISSVNIRHAQELPGIAAPLMRHLTDGNGIVQNTLLVSPPRCGKTTLLRDIVRMLSSAGYIVGVCDERSEIAGMHDGQPSFSIGENTDVMDNCPKAEGMLMLIRSMGPDVIATDEIGKAEDIEAIEHALLSGVSVIATAHGGSRAELAKSRIAPLLKSGVFRNVVFLGRHPQIGSIREIVRLGAGREQTAVQR